MWRYGGFGLPPQTVPEGDAMMSQSLESALRTCTDCGIAKPTSEFYKAKFGTDRRQAHCKKCTLAKQHIRYKKNRGEMLEKAHARYNEKPEQYRYYSRMYARRNSEYRKIATRKAVRKNQRERPIEYRAMSTYHRIVKRCKEKGWPIDDRLTKQFYCDLYQRNPNCNCCNIKLCYEFGFGQRHDLPSIDRIDNDIGYMVENIAVICRACNKLKATGTLQKFEAIVKYMKSSGDRTVILYGAGVSA